MREHPDFTGTRPPSASFLRRVAEAADGFRSGSAVYFAAAEVPPHEILGPFGDEESAAEAAHRANQVEKDLSKYRVFGPCLTGAEETSKSSIVSISVTVRDAQGMLSSVAIDPDECDALIWSLSALDKFVLPYVTLVSGVGEAARIRKEFVERTPFLGPHKKLSYWDPTPIPETFPFPGSPPTTNPEPEKQGVALKVDASGQTGSEDLVLAGSLAGSDT